MYKILISNDDGIDALGIRTLVKSFGNIAELHVFAPAGQKSATSQSITFRNNVKIEKREMFGAKSAYAVDGTPADCVKMGISILAEQGIVPDFVLSGINMGENTGAAVNYSGTFAAAKEGALQGIRSIALSVANHEAENFEGICNILNELIELSLMLEPKTVLNVNAPDLPSWKLKGTKITETAEYGFGQVFGFVKLDDENEFKMSMLDREREAGADNDWSLVREGYITISPVTVVSDDALSLRKLKGSSNDRLVAVFVDVQEKLVPAMRKSEDLVKNNVKFAKCLRRLDVPMLATTQYSRGLGETVPELDKAMGKHETIDKVSFSCFDNSDFQKRFDGMVPGRVILTGMEAHICVEQTALDFLARGYEVYIVKDCVSSRKKEDLNTALDFLAQQGCKITTWEAVVYEILKSSMHPAFKKISEIVKE